MLGYILKRAISLIVSLCLASIIIFSVVEIAPGDPASFMLGINAQEDTIAALRAELGLDQDKLSRYFSWISGMVKGDFGTSYTYRSPVSDMIKERIWVSLPLALYALLISTFIAFPAGIYAATQRGKAGDAAVMGATQFGIAIPNFWFAMILVVIFALKLRWVLRRWFCGMGKRYSSKFEIFNTSSYCSSFASSFYTITSNAKCAD